MPNKPTQSSPERTLTLHHEPDAVTYARTAAGLTKAQLADLIGKSAQLVGDIEAGRRNATPAVLKDIARVLNCPLVVLQRKRWMAS